MDAPQVQGGPGVTGKPISVAPGTTGALPAGAPGSPTGAAGPAGPMVTPQGNEGLIAAARTNVQIAVRVLSMELSKFPVESPEFKGVHQALGVLQKTFGKTADADRELIPGEVKSLLSKFGERSPAANVAASRPSIAPPPAPAGAPA